MRLGKKQRKMIINRPTRDLEYKLAFIGSILGFFSSFFHFVLYEFVYESVYQVSIAILGSISGAAASLVAYMCLNLVDYQTRKFAISIAVCSIWGLISVNYFYSIPAFFLLFATFLCFLRRNREIKIVK
ncbi:hypothetical protein [Pseudalkalibacillus sp. SCS-8]|uniref:hypothetical protein n=1 Tax=Pseudalkalibacillus nanhaiensis TaxID=3115291 RepID=UPI0032DBA6FC